MATATDAITGIGSKVPVLGKNRTVAMVVGLVVAALIVYTVIAFTKPWGDLWGSKINARIQAGAQKMKGDAAVAPSEPYGGWS